MPDSPALRRRPRAFVDLPRGIRYAVRLLRKSPGFTATVVLTLAVGLGGATAIFTVVNDTLFRPMMLRDVEALVRLDDMSVGPGGLGNETNISPLNVEALRARQTVFSSMSVQDARTFVLTGGGAPERLRGAGVSEGWTRTSP